MPILPLTSFFIKVNFFKKYIPILSWLPNYNKEALSGDLSAGLTVGVMLIPQGIAYAMIAGLPPIYGLYTAMTPQVIYAVFGTSRQLSVGPTAMDSLIVAAGITSIATVNPDNYIAAAILLAFLFKSLNFYWLAFLVVLAEFQIVLLRFVFSYEQTLMSDLVRFWYGSLFLFANPR